MFVSDAQTAIGACIADPFHERRQQVLQDLEPSELHGGDLDLPAEPVGIQLFDAFQTATKNRL
jgi:hypothetical protein